MLKELFVKLDRSRKVEALTEPADPDFLQRVNERAAESRLRPATEDFFDHVQTFMHHRELMDSRWAEILGIEAGYDSVSLERESKSVFRPEDIKLDVTKCDSGNFFSNFQQQVVHETGSVSIVRSLDQLYDAAAKALPSFNALLKEVQQYRQFMSFENIEDILIGSRQTP